MQLKNGTKLGKYKIEKKLSSGGFSVVYRAKDLQEGAKVAIKVPSAGHQSAELKKALKNEMRYVAKLDHPGILHLKNADEFKRLFFLVFPLGEKSLTDRLKSRLAVRKGLDYTEQLLEAMAHAHGRRIIHCDIKPDNVILFPDDRLRIGDFGIARAARKTLSGSGSGTMGYIAPEQAMGQISMRSDVFSLGLVIYFIFARKLPRWPFKKWPGMDRLKKALHPDMIAFILRALDVNDKRRFKDAIQMHKAFLKLKKTALKKTRR
jgi:serine/threonine-protein kinase